MSPPRQPISPPKRIKTTPAHQQATVQCPTCRANARHEIYRSSPDGETWVLKSVLRCLSARLHPCPAVIAELGFSQPIMVEPKNNDLKGHEPDDQ